MVFKNVDYKIPIAKQQNMKLTYLVKLQTTLI